MPYGMPTAGVDDRRSKRRKVKRRKPDVASQIGKSVAGGKAVASVGKTVKKGSKPKVKVGSITAPPSIARSMRQEQRKDIRRVKREGRLSGTAKADTYTDVLGARVPDEVATALNVASLLPPGRAAKVGGTVAKTILGGEKALSVGAKATKVERLGSKARAAEKAGRARTATRARRAEAKAASKAETKRRRQQRNLDRTIRGEGGVKGAAGRTWNKRQPANLTKAGRQVKRRQRIAGATVAGAGAPAVVLGPGADYVATTGKAIGEDFKEGKPLRTVSTTIRTAKAIPSAMAGDAIDVVKYLGGDEEAGKRALDSYKSYLEAVNRVASGDTETVQKEVGLVPLASGGLAALGVAKGLGGAIRPSSPLHARKVRRLRDKAELGGSVKERQAAKNKLDDMDASRGQRRSERRTEARAHDVTQRNIELQSSQDLRTGGKGRKSLGRRVVRLENTPVTKDVSQADMIQFLGREGLYEMTPDAALREVARRRESLSDPAKALPADATHTRMVLDAILANPSVLRSRELREVNSKGFGPADRQFSIERHTERKGEKQTTPDPRDDRARYQHLRRAENIPDEGERVPPALRDKTKVRARVGQDAERAIRDEANKLRTKAKRLRSQAASHSRNSAKRRALIEDAEEAKLTARALFVSINRARQADALERRAARIENGTAKKVGPDEDPAAMRAQAQEIRRDVQADIEALRAEALAETQAVIKDKGYSEPIYFPESKVDDQGKLNVAYGDEYLGSSLPPTEKYRTGTLAKEGRINESSAALMDNFFRRRVSLEMRTHVREALARNNFDPGDGRGEVRPGAEWRRLMDEGKLPEGTSLFPMQEWNRVLQSGKWDDAQGLLDKSVMTDARLAKMEDGQMYSAWPGEAKREFRAQMDTVSKGLKRARVASRIQSGIMLGTSPLWFEFQLLASPIALAYRHHNPARWAKEGTKLVTDWRKIPKRDRLRFQAEFGGTSADVFDMRDIRAGVRPETVQGLHGAMSVAMKSPAGRVLNHLAKGGPLIAGNRKFEGGVRTLAAMLEMDKAINGKRATQAIQSIAKASDETQKMLTALRGKSKAEQVEWLLSKDGRAAKRRVVDGVNDGLGDWTSLTSKERAAAAVAVFYPFLRFSMKWAAIVAPRDNPFLFALVLNASQQNAQELEAMGEGDTSTFDIGNVVIHGEQNQLLDLGRVSPAGGAVAEALAQGEINLATFTRMTWPALGIPITTAAGVDPLSGDPTKASPGESLIKGGLGLSPVTRPAIKKLYPPSDPSIAAAKIEGRDQRSYLEQLLVPDILNPASEFEKTSSLFDALEGSTSPDDGEYIPRVTDNPENVRNFAREYVREGEVASKNRDKLTRIMEEAGVDTTQDAKAIEKFFSIVASIRAKKVSRTEKSDSIFDSGGDSIFDTGGKSIFDKGGKSIFDE